MAWPSLTRSDLMALSRKYRVLSQARRLGDPLSTEVGLLCREFPGVLSELDRLPLAEIDRRLEALERAWRTGELEPWMPVVLAFHRSMRAALLLRRELAGWTAPVDAELSAELAALVSRRTGFECDAELVAALALPDRPPLMVVVLGCLSRQLATPVTTLRRVLFPGPQIKISVWTRI